MVRAAPSSRVGARSIDVQSEGWAGSQNLAGKTEVEQSEKSEVQMLEMRKMIEEQALLIKSLTSKS
tara:strand:+ start:810 stop:1007 length:198 start_codon:yes stop_codon:yes gene_type:complete